jgi:AAA domain-containing protein
MSGAAAVITRIRANTPAQLRELPVWLLWSAEEGEDGRIKKVPIRVDGKNRSGTLDTAEDRALLVPFEEAAAALADVPRAVGLGVALGEVPGEEMRLAGIDFDHCYHDGELDERLLQILAAGGSYAERSPSGDGIHIVGTGDIGVRKKDGCGFEIYSGARFFTMTGEAINTAGLADITGAAALTRQLYEDTQGSKSNGGAAGTVHDGIGAGSRNTYLSGEAFRLRKQGFTVEQILPVLQAMNAAHCRPALPDAEVEQIARGKERVNQDPPAQDEWVPPAVATYGATFDASKIPLRQWVLGQRRAIGEVTVDAGPPGVNKSMLLVSDAVQITTGRKILADAVHATGEVLLLAGEDSRRDVEARLAGILAYYHITPAELADRLHVVYLTEVDASSYCLANMAADLATLNTRMLNWLREYPRVVAVFVDPLMAWHRLIENSNDALQLLCTAMRSLAVRGRRHVGFDHHVTKVSQVDVEAHVGNLTALRGAGVIAADVRWAFTLARLKPETAAAHGIAEDARRGYRRLDPLKASYGPDDAGARLLRIESVAIANGETVGVLVEVDMQRTREAAAERVTAAKELARQNLTMALSAMLIHKGPTSGNATALYLATHHPDLLCNKKGEPYSVFTIRRRLPTLIGAGLDTRKAGAPARIVIREAKAKGKGDEVAFEQDDAL